MDPGFTGLGVTEGLPLRARRLAESRTVVVSVRMMLPGSVADPGVGLGRMKMPLVGGGTVEAMDRPLTGCWIHHVKDGKTGTPMSTYAPLNAGMRSFLAVVLLFLIAYRKYSDFSDVQFLC